MSPEKLCYMLLALDFGNTRTKAAVFERNILIKTFVFNDVLSQEVVLNILTLFPEIKKIIAVSVSVMDNTFFEFLSKSYKVHFLNRKDIFPFVNHYKTPETLGLDRMILASAAVLMYPRKNRLVIDAGTCVTYDFIDEKDNYLGGAISPGIRLRYKALNDYTEKLPLLDTEAPENINGLTTRASIHSGVVNGIIYEIEGMIDEIRKGKENFIIILTGGDSDFLAKRLKSIIFAHSNFLLEGLNLYYQFLYKHE